MPRVSAGRLSFSSSSFVRGHTPRSIVGLVLALALIASEDGVAAEAGTADTAIDRFVDPEARALARGYDARLRHAPSTLVVFDREAIERSGALTVAELLERVVGVHITRRNYGASADQYVRGIGGNWIILHNGVEIEKTLPELLALPLSDAERVEVLKGSHFAIYGPSAITGTINIVTFGVEEDTLAAGLRGGTLGTSEVWLRRSARRGRFGYGLHLSHLATEGSEATIVADRQSLLDAAFGTDVSRAPGEGAFEREVLDARLTLALGERWSLEQLFSERGAGVGVGLAQALDPNGEERLSRHAATLRYRRPLTDGALEARLTYNRVRARVEDAEFLPPGTLGGAFPAGVLQSYGQSGREIATELLLRRRLGAHTLELGVGGAHGTVDNDLDVRNYTARDGSETPVPVGDLVSFLETDPLFDGDYAESTVYALVRDRWAFTDDARLELGVRLDRSSDYGAVVNPRVGLEWALAEATDLVLLYGESSITPSLIERTSNGLFAPLGDPALEPAKIRMLEAALTHRASERVTFEASLFAYRQEASVAEVDDPASPNGRRFANIDDESVGRGLDLVVRWTPRPDLAFVLGIALATNDTDDTNNIGAPEVQPYAEANARFGRGWNANVALIGVAERERDPGDAREPIEDYAIVNATLLNRGVVDGATFSLAVQNLLDADAREDISPAIVEDLPVWPRRILAGVSYAF